MPKYVLGHHLKGEVARLELMSELRKLDEALVDRFLAHSPQCTAVRSPAKPQRRL